MNPTYFLALMGRARYRLRKADWDRLSSLGGSTGQLETLVQEAEKKGQVSEIVEISRELRNSCGKLKIPEW